MLCIIIFTRESVKDGKLILFYVFSKISHWKNKIITKKTDLTKCKSVFWIVLRLLIISLLH